ncbi:MAG: hypothetical protein SFY68_08285 [Candidatus Sumerlaeia bacterium]|nr:hypothetical protein [Candidatus Sumerlaeia bacterium]
MGLPAKMALLVSLGLLLQEKMQGRMRWVLVLWGAQFITTAWNLFGVWEGGPVGPVIAISFVVGLCLLISASAPEGAFVLQRGFGWQSLVGWTLVVLGFFWPFFSKGIVGVGLSSSLLILPHGVLVFLGGILIMSYPNAPRLVLWGVVLGCCSLGSVDLWGGSTVSGGVLWSAGVVVGAQPLVRVFTLGGVLEEDRPPLDVQRERAERTVFKKKQDEGKRWKLK